MERGEGGLPPVHEDASPFSRLERGTYRADVMFNVQILARVALRADVQEGGGTVTSDFFFWPAWRTTYAPHDLHVTYESTIHPIGSTRSTWSGVGARIRSAGNPRHILIHSTFHRALDSNPILTTAHT